MISLYADVTEPPLVLRDRVFREPVRISGRGTYGRVLFTTHDVLVERCRFLYEAAPAAGAALLEVYGLCSATFSHNWFGPEPRADE